MVDCDELFLQPPGADEEPKSQESGGRVAGGQVQVTEEVEGAGEMIGGGLHGICSSWTSQCIIYPFHKYTGPNFHHNFKKFCKK